jgi:AraC-like DNA-binding protein/mannose-6-phosphate isomerase-like protein (cupin superfamily)
VGGVSIAARTGGFGVFWGKKRGFWATVPGRVIHPRMADGEPRALYQGFLPSGGQHAYVWKYAESVGGRRPRHFHAEPELNLVVSGDATLAVGDRHLHVTAGELVAFPPGVDHLVVAGSPDLYLYAIGLDSKYSAEVLGPAGDPGVPFHVRLGSDELANVVERAAAIVDRSGADQLGAELWQRLHSVTRGSASRAISPVHVLTRRALGRLRAAPELGLGALAGELGAHPSEISRHFHRDFGTTLVRYRTRLRLLHFMRFMDAGEGDLTAAACASGFGSYSQCHRTFQAEFDCSPRQFFQTGVRERMQLRYG